MDVLENLVSPRFQAGDGKGNHQGNSVDLTIFHFFAMCFEAFVNWKLIMFLFSHLMIKKPVRDVDIPKILDECLKSVRLTLDTLLLL